MASDAWPEDIPIWIDGVQKWMTGLTRRTTCDDIIYALLYARGLLDTDSPDNYAVFERWRAVERPLEGRTKIVKVWSAWDKEQPNVQLLVQRLDDYFIPPEASKIRRRHRRYTRQRLRHADTKCRCCGGRGQQPGGRTRAAEQLARHLVRQEQQLQELRQRAAETDRQIALHEARQHARRVQQNGTDYVQDSYLLHPTRRRAARGDGGEDDQESAEGSSEDSRREGGSDFSCHSGGSISSTCSVDSLDDLLLAVGEDDLDKYLDLCANLHDVIARLEQAERTQQALAKDIEMDAAERDRRQEVESEEAGTAEALRVQIIREVAASVLQQQQEIDVVRELRLWESKVKERSKRVRQLQDQLDTLNKSANTHQQNQAKIQRNRSSPETPHADAAYKQHSQDCLPHQMASSRDTASVEDHLACPSEETRHGFCVSSSGSYSAAPAHLDISCPCSDGRHKAPGIGKELCRPVLSSDLNRHQVPLGACLEDLSWPFASENDARNGDITPETSKANGQSHAGYQERFTSNKDSLVVKNSLLSHKLHGQASNMQPILSNTLKREQEVTKFDIQTRSGQGTNTNSPILKSPLASKTDDSESKPLASEELTHKNSTTRTLQPNKTVASLQLEQDLIGSSVPVEKSRWRTLSCDGTAMRRRSRSASRERTDILKPPIPPRNPSRAGDVVYVANNHRLDLNKAEIYAKTEHSLQLKPSSISHLSREQYSWPLFPQTFTNEQFGGNAKDQNSVHTNAFDIPSGPRLSVSGQLAASPQAGELVLPRNSAHSYPVLPLTGHTTNTQDYLHQNIETFSPHENGMSNHGMQQSNHIFNRQDSPKVQEQIGHIATGLASDLKERLSDCPGNYRMKNSLELSNKEMQSYSNVQNQGSHYNQTECPKPFYKSVQQSSISHWLRYPSDHVRGTDSQTNDCLPVSMNLVGSHDLIVSHEIKLSKPDFCFPIERPALPQRQPVAAQGTGLKAATSSASLPGSNVCVTSDQDVSRTSSDRNDGVPMLVNQSNNWPPASHAASIKGLGYQESQGTPYNTSTKFMTTGSSYKQGQNDKDTATILTNHVSTLSNDCKSYPETHGKRTDTVQKEYSCGNNGDRKGMHAYGSFFDNPVNGRSDSRRCVTRQSFNTRKGAYDYNKTDPLRNDQAVPSQPTTNAKMSNGLDPYKSMTLEASSTVPPFFPYSNLAAMGDRSPAVHQRHLTLMTSQRDDSGVGSSDSSTDSGMLLMEAAADHCDVIGSRPSAARRAPLCLGPDSYLDLSLFGLGQSVDVKAGQDASRTPASPRGRDYSQRDVAIGKTPRTLTSSSHLDLHSYPSSSSTISMTSSGLSSSSSQMASSTSVPSPDTKRSQDMVALGSSQYSCPKPPHYTISYETVVTEDDWLHSTDDDSDVFESGDHSEGRAKHEKDLPKPRAQAVAHVETASERASLASGQDNTAPPTNLAFEVQRNPPCPQSIIKHRSPDAALTTSTSAVARPAPIIGPASDKRRNAHAVQAKTVRFAEEMNSWAWCDADDDAGESSDDTGLSSLQADDVLVTLV